MQAFDIHQQIVQDYLHYLKSFLEIQDDRIRELVQGAFSKGAFIPEPLIQFNPSYKPSEHTVDGLVGQGTVHPDFQKIFPGFNFHHHQAEAILKGIRNESFVVTSGTGSGKSLTYLSCIFNSLLNAGSSKGVKAILVYPMNALINSQEVEIKKYEANYLASFVPEYKIDEHKKIDEILADLKSKTRARFPITYARYTGQEKGEAREAIENEQPNIILTNYMMLELIMTRHSEEWMRDSMKEHLRFLVFDELHTYRGRQGSDVSMLVRRIHHHAKHKLMVVGTSATMSTEGSIADRKQAVADVAQTIFSVPFSRQDIIGETLATCTAYTGQLPPASTLSSAVSAPIDVNASADLFRSHPLAIWVENRVALKHTPFEGNTVLERGTPLSLTEMVKLLREDSGCDEASCRSALEHFLRWCERLNLEGSRQRPRQSYLPFKLHQFISQTGHVYVTLESRAERHIRLEPGRYLKTGEEELPLYPVQFSRYTGHDFICVSKQGNYLKPRDPNQLPLQITQEELKGDKKNGQEKRHLTESDFPDGYIVLSLQGEEVYSETDEADFPESWFDKKGRLTNFYEHRLPRKIWFDRKGNFSHDEVLECEGWFVPAQMLYDPTAKIVYDTRTSERTKLMPIANEGRGTATTLTSFSVVKALMQGNVEAPKRKLLSFTDNRQDASLQAGHFNDFMKLGRLRSAVYHALKEAGDKTLTVDELVLPVLKKLNLPESEYARNPSEDPDDPDKRNQDALKDYLLVQLLYDLERGWRYITPNLEHCGLLKIRYYRLEEIAGDDELFKDLDLFNKLDAEKRLKLLYQVLDFFRTSFSIDHYKITDDVDVTQTTLDTKLDDRKLWSLDYREKIEEPVLLLPRSPGEPKKNVQVASIGSQSALGRHFRRLFREYDVHIQGKDEFSAFMEELCLLLKKKGLLKQRTVYGKSDTVYGYRLKADAILYTLGDGSTGVFDEVRMVGGAHLKARVNPFFREFYRQDFSRFGKTLEGREHTGQLSTEDRIDREDRFRAGQLAALFCSPTMELGIDISDLNVVHMRNVPPNPANYAQRSGRAGRSGQAALVFTYCSAFSPHDRNYFNESKKMVAGAVAPPKIDLSNEELVLTHLNAFILMELKLQSMKTCAGDVLDLNDPVKLPIKSDISSFIQQQTRQYRNDWILDFKAITGTIPGLNTTTWFTESWLIDKADKFLERFHNSFDRWRRLYRDALRNIDEARLKIDSPMTDEITRKYAKREEAVGHRKKAVLMNNEGDKGVSESEFYVFRYLASEGFLPGYNFTRLPVRNFVGMKSQDKGQFISRPRFVALREFGPQNIIYHNGSKYSVGKMLVNPSGLILHKLSISQSTGHAYLDAQGDAINNDPINRRELKGQTEVAHLTNMLVLDEMESWPRERISSREEERRSNGYEIDSAFQLNGGIENSKRSEIRNGDVPILTVLYNPSATLYMINSGFKQSSRDGYEIGKHSGRWKSSDSKSNQRKKKEDEEDPNVHVRIFTHNQADILYLQPVSNLQLTESGRITLSYALKRGIEKRFQVEQNEVGVWIMGKQEAKNILLYESSEGSLGVMKELAENGQSLREVFVEAYKVCHFDPDTRSDTRPELEKASYEDLLSYYNQRDHDHIDRHAVKEALELLIDSTVSPLRGENNYEAHYAHLLSRYDENSEMERIFIQYLFKNGLALPDRAQQNLDGLYVSVDFIYNTETGPVLVFIDGKKPADKVAHQKKQRQACRDAGYLDIIEWHYTEKIETLVERYKNIFRKVR